MITNSYTLENRCGNPTTTDCIQYTGPSIPCLGIQSGCVLTKVECSIANSLCQLLGDVDMSTVIIPTCFSTAFATGDLSIQHFLQILLNIACTQQISLEGIETSLPNLDPIISITYPSCCNSQCNPGTTLAISKHLENILVCLCNVYSLIGTLPTGYTNVGDTLSSFRSSINCLINTVSGQSAAIQQIQTVLNAQGNTLPILPSSTCNPI